MGVQEAVEAFGRHNDKIAGAEANPHPLSRFRANVKNRRARKDPLNLIGPVNMMAPQFPKNGTKPRRFGFDAHGFGQGSSVRPAKMAEGIRILGIDCFNDHVFRCQHVERN